MPVRAALFRLVGRVAILALPIGLVLCLYFVFDPFKVLRHHATFYPPGDHVGLNRDFVSTEEFLRLESTRPNAYVFGSSRSMAFRCAEWRRYLPPGARPFHFDAWLETVYGVWRKVVFLDAEGMKIEDALVVLETGDFAQASNVYSPLFIKHPRLSGEPAIVFQTLQAGAFFAHLFFVKYLDFETFGQLRPYMLDVFEQYPLRQVRETNDLVFQGYEDELNAGEDAYYARHAATFTEREPYDAPAMFGARQIAELEEVARIFEKHGTRVRIIVSPLYGQGRLAASDRERLERLFGKERVFDFSGKNAITDDVRNYYEISHYRPHVANELLRIAYGAARAADSP